MTRASIASRSAAAAALGALVLLAACGDGGGSPVAKAKRPAKAKRAVVGGAPPFVPTEVRELRASLKAHDFEGLERRFTDLMARWKADPRTENDLRRAYEAFSTGDVALAEYLDAWVDARPSAVSHTARGYYREEVGFRRRGTRVASEVNKERMREYANVGALARADLKEAIQLDAGHAPAYWELLAMEHVDRDERRRLLDEVLKLDPASSVARVKYVHLLQPKWGGSMEEIALLVDGAREHFDANPRLRGLAGYAKFVEGDMASRSGRRAEAERLFTEALEQGAYGFYHRERAQERIALGRLAEAIDDCDRGLEIAGADARLLQMRGEAYLNLRNADRALEDLDVAIELEPTLPVARYLRAFVRCNKKDWEGSLADAREATELDPRHLGGWEKAGYALLMMDRPGEAVPFLEMALRLSEGDRVCFANYFLGSALHLAHDEKAFEHFKAYLDVARPDTPGIDPKCVDFAKKLLESGPEERWQLASSNPILALR